MNIIRDGLAAIIIMLAVQAIRKGTLKRVVWRAVPAILFHYAALFSISYIIISQRPWLRFMSVLAMLGFLFFSVAAFLAAELYFLQKAVLYAPGEAKGTLGGLFSLFGVFRVSIMLGVLLFGKLPAADKFKLVILGEIFLVTAAFISQYSYAGIRLYLIVSLVCPLSILASYSRLGFKFERSLKAVLIASSLLGAAASYNGFLATEGQGTNSFLPYETWLF